MIKVHTSKRHMQMNVRTTAKWHCATVASKQSARIGETGNDGINNRNSWSVEHYTHCSSYRNKKIMIEMRVAYE